MRRLVFGLVLIVGCAAPESPEESAPEETVEQAHRPSVERLDTPTAAGSVTPSLSADPSGGVHLTWVEEGALRRTTWGTQGWEPPTTVAECDTTADPVCTLTPSLGGSGCSATSG